MVRLHIFSDIFISGKNVKDNIFARNENIGKMCKRNITWTDFNGMIFFNISWSVIVK